MSIHPFAAAILAAAPVIKPAEDVTATTNFSTSQINLTWTDVSKGHEGQEIWYQAAGPVTDPADSGTMWADLTPGEESDQVTGLSSGTTYDFQIVTYRGDIRVRSEVFTGQTDTNPIPDTPTITGVSASDVDALTVNISGNGSGNTAGFEVKRSSDGGFTYGGWIDIGLDFSWFNTGLAVGDTYHYKARAYSSGKANYSGVSNVASGTTRHLNISVSGDWVYKSPTNPTGAITMVWTENGTFGGDTVVIERSPDNSSFSDHDSEPDGVEIHSDSVPSGTTKYYRLRGKRTNARGTFNGSPTSSDGATTDQTAPAAPTNLSVTAFDADSISISWTDNSNNEDKFVVKWKDPTTIGWDDVDMIGTADRGVNVTTYTISGLSNNTGYEIAVFAENTADQVQCTSPSSVTQTTADGVAEVVTINAIENTESGTYKAICSGSVDEDTESLAVYYEEITEFGFGLGVTFLENIDVSPNGSYQTSNVVADQCHEVRFEVTPYPQNNQGGTQGTTATDTVLLNNYGADTC